MANKMRKVAIKAEKVADFIDQLVSSIHTYEETNEGYLNRTENHTPDELDNWDRGTYDRNREFIDAFCELLDDLERVKL